MIKFFARLMIFFLMNIFVFGFVSGVHAEPFLIACMFICAWIVVIPFRDIVWWLIIFASIFSMVYYDNFAIYIITLIGIAYLFDYIYTYLKRSGNENLFTLYLVILGLSSVVSVIIELVQLHDIVISFQIIVINLIVTSIIFLSFWFIVKRIEGFINLYAHSGDMRCHT
jgi:hypothetical protein